MRRIASELRRAQFGPLFARTTPAEYKEALKEKIGKRFDWLARELSGRDCLMGKHFTVADGYLFTILTWTDRAGIDLARWPVLAAYRAGVAARPKVRDAMIAEGSLKESAATI